MKPKNPEPVNQTSEESNSSSQSTANNSTPTVSSSASTATPNKLRDRFSMFEQPLANQNLKLTKKPDTNQENIEENAQDTPTIINAANKANKPLPPIPSKPPRPAIFAQPTLFNSSNISNTTKPKSDEPRQPSIMVKLRPVNGNSTTTKEVNSENVSITLNNASSENAQPEKRASVKELAQMLNEESKVIKYSLSKFSIL